VIGGDFGSSPTIRYKLNRSSDITLTAYDPAGRKVTTLYQGLAEPGTSVLTWNTSTVPAGVYFVRLVAGGHNITERVVVVR
jgi:hypothetical protein